VNEHTIYSIQGLMVDAKKEATDIYDRHPSRDEGELFEVYPKARNKW
jgi:hypothetical protein